MFGAVSKLTSLSVDRQRERERERERETTKMVYRGLEEFVALLLLNWAEVSNH